MLRFIFNYLLGRTPSPIDMGSMRCVRVVVSDSERYAYRWVRGLEAGD